MARHYFKFLSSFLFATLSLTSVASAQRPRHADTWVFGTRCRMGWDAAGATATSTLDPVLSTLEGSATFSDPDTGVPLVVTDGNNVWNGIGTLLATGLMGDSSSMHAGIIVPVPGSPGRVYVFGHPSTTSSQISYRAFDTTGLGTALGAGASAIALPATQGREGMIAIAHTNGRDFWIVISGATQVFVVPVTTTGVGAAVAYPTQVNVWASGWHMFAASPDGRRLAISGNSISARAAFESLPFNPTTGVVSAGTLFTASSDYRQAYGGAFSPDGTKLYFATLDEVQSGGVGPTLSRAVQYDFTTSTFTNLHNSTTRYSHGDVRRGPDGRMYMAGQSIGANLSVIATPNAAGAAAGYSNASYPLIATCTPQLGIGQAIDNLYSLRFRCGDGVVSGSEACDDGNSADGDGCSAACTVETNSSCAPLLLNGGFELGTLGNDLTGAALTGWTISGGTVDHTTAFPRTEGNASIDLTGCAAGTITQTVPTVPGTTYRLLFDYGANSFDNLRFAAEALDAAGATLRSTEFRADASVLGTGAAARLVSGEISFTATTATSTIRFRTTLNNACGGNWLDNVRLGPSTCDSICGNGRIDMGETCDDANTTAGDGCSATCAVESGFACANPDILLVNYSGAIGASQRAFLGTRGTVTTDSGATITTAFLSRFDVVIFNGIRTFTAAEATALSSWVNAGGGLFLFTGHANEASIATSATSMLTGLGIEIFAPNFSSAATMQRHPVSTGVSPAIPFNGGFGVRPAAASPLVGSTTFALGGTTSLGIAGSLGAGRAVVYGDEWIYFETEWTGNAGVRRFWPNVMDWITGASACDRLCGNGVVNTGEACDDGNLASSDGCSNACAVEPGYTCTGMPSVCSICVDSGEGIDTGCTASAPVCVGTGSAAICVACIDNGMGGVVDSGCTMGAPLCLGTGATASCQPCQDTTSGGTDLGCMMGAPACASSGGANICLACEDSAMGTGIDNGCVMDTPLCAMTSGGGVQCVACTLDAQCMTGTVCSPTTNTCVPGCDMDDDCAATPATPVCNVAGRVCVPCLTSTDCDGTETCTPMFQCVQPDTDNDGVRDDIDLDDDNDGIPDTAELPDGLSTDSDMDGIVDFQDPDFVTCTAGTSGACTELPENVDLDRDGIPNQLDLDADGDGIIDVTEGGGVAAMDGTIADFADLNMNGLADSAEAMPLPLPNSDMTGLADFLDVDSDADGVLDGVEGFDADHDGSADVDPAGIDSDTDGIDDAFDLDCAAAADCGGVIGVVAPLPDTDSDTRPDYRDLDDDGDGMNTSIEIQDAMDYTGPIATPEDIDGDGQPNWLDTDTDGDMATDRTESGGDRDNDDNGILDYMDPNYAPTDTDGDGVIDTVECPAPATVAMGNCPDSDMDGSPDYDDVDDDNDGIPTSIEEMAGPDSDGDGTPNRLDLDSDDDGITDLREQNGSDVDGNNDGAIDSARDADMDGIDAAFDANDMDAMVGFSATTRGLDTDRDGQIDAADLDADGDGITDLIEGGGRDADRDGKIDGDTDANNNGIRDAAEGAGRLAVPDTDMDGDADFQDIDADGDGKNDAIEGHDVNHDGVADVRPRGTDANNNGLDDAYEAMGGTPAPLPDTDGDMTPDYRDTDDDGDGVLSRFESPGTLDTDMDGTPNYLDPDDDGDGTDTADEAPDANSDGNPVDARDTDMDGIPDYLDPTGSMPSPGGLAGGACGCAVNTTRSTSGLFAMLGMLALVAVRRRRKR